MHVAVLHELDRTYSYPFGTDAPWILKVEAYSTRTLGRSVSKCSQLLALDRLLDVRFTLGS